MSGWAIVEEPTGGTAWWYITWNGEVTSAHRSIGAAVAALIRHLSWEAGK